MDFQFYNIVFQFQTQRYLDKINFCNIKGIRVEITFMGKFYFSQDGAYPLHMCVGQLNCVKVLLEHGASPDIQDLVQNALKLVFIPVKC
jgi:hypothetical protein